jgi:hypothetical protein
LDADGGTLENIGDGGIDEITSEQGFSTARATPSRRSKATVSKRFLSRLQWFDPAILAVFA